MFTKKDRQPENSKGRNNGYTDADPGIENPVADVTQTGLAQKN
jgi:hypothetical protein